MTSASAADRQKFSLKQLGPGLLMAGAAIGVSHLVQSTRAGALYGWGALVFVLLANLMKYPFYEYGHRYAAASGKNLIQAYRQQGKQFFIPFLVISVIGAVGAFAADSLVAAMLLQYIWLPEVSGTLLAVGVLLFCWGLIAVGRYRLFEQITKWCVIFLAVATVAAVVMAVFRVLMTAPAIAISPLLDSNLPPSTALEVANTTIATHRSVFSWSAIPFLIAFMGWMPGGLELSIWQSLWVQADGLDRGKATSLAEASLDFNVGYLLTVVLACLFLALGTLTLPEQGLADEPAQFAGQLIGMYTRYIGQWAEPVIGLSALAAIFSTTFTIVDAFPRTLEAGLHELFPATQASSLPIRQGITFVLIGLAALLLNVFTAGFELLISTITIIAFVFAPFYAWLNMRCIDTLDEAAQPEPWLKKLALVGFVYLTGFSLVFIGWQFVGYSL
jgi:Mn2+/Fe2+ NRAMP family transporter